MSLTAKVGDEQDRALAASSGPSRRALPVVRHARGPARDDVGGLGTSGGNRHAGEVFAGNHAGVAKGDDHRFAVREVR